MDNGLREKLDEMNALFRHAIQIAGSLNLPFDRIQAVRTAVGGLNDPTLYANNIKPSQGIS
jgi:hypothetical protein